MWEFDTEQAAALTRDKENKKFLPGVKIPEGIRIETDIAGALHGAGMVIMVVPSHVVRATAKANILQRLSAALQRRRGTLQRSFFQALRCALLTSTLRKQGFTGQSSEELR